MRFLRKKIFMGECSDGIIYYNTVTNEVLIADKSRLINTVKSSKNNRYAAIGVLLLLMLMFFFTSIYIIGRYTSIFFLIFILITLSQIILNFILFERALYKNVKKTQLATRKQFREAVYRVNWIDSKNPKITLSNKLTWWLITIIMFIVALYMPIHIYIESYLRIGENIIINKDFGVLMLSGIMISVGIYLIFQNNIIRWGKVVEKYQKNKLKMITVNSNKKEKIMNEQVLPLGSVVKLKNGDGSELMIINRAMIVTNQDGDEEYFDYGSIIIPFGVNEINDIYFFNRENVDEVLFKGYINKAEKEYIHNYDAMILSINVKKGRVD